MSNDKFKGCPRCGQRTKKGLPHWDYVRNSPLGWFVGRKFTSHSKEMKMLVKENPYAEIEILWPAYEGDCPYPLI